MLRVGTAPVSYGFYGVAVEGQRADSSRLLANMADSGYLGTELGPPGLFGTPDELKNAAAAASLEIIGGYVPLHLTDENQFAPDLMAMETTLDELQATAPDSGLAILADVGTPELMANPARHWSDRRLALSDAEWRGLADRLARAIDLADSRGLATSFHPHVSTFVESPWEVERLLALTDISLTLDTGHLFLAGTSSAECMRAWKERINHIHVKDVHLSVLNAAKEASVADFDSWWDQVCCRLGEGDVDLETFVATVLATGYEGWLVVEHDRAPARPSEYASIGHEQRTNFDWLTQQLSIDPESPAGL